MKFRRSVLTTFLTCRTLPQECKIRFREHVHLPDCDVCVICSSAEQEDPAALPDPPVDGLSGQVEPQPSKVDDVLQTSKVTPTKLGPSTALTVAQAGLVVPVPGLNIQLPGEAVCSAAPSRRSIRKRIKNWVKSGGKSSA